MTIRAGLLVGWMVLASSAGAQMMKAADAGEKGTEAAANDPVLDEAAQQIGRAMFLRCLCQGETLSFDAQGRIAPGTKSKPVDWTLDGFDVAKVSRKSPEEIELDGVRVAVRWNDDVRQFQRHPFKDQPVRVIIAGDSDRTAMQHSIRAIFSVGIDHAFQMSMPPYWQHYFFPKLPWPADPALGTAPIQQAGVKVNGVELASPTPMKKAESSYTFEASRDHVQGPVVLQVTIDETGKSHRVAVVQPLGYGLDAAAVVAAEKTVFAPPLVDGKPAPLLVLLRENYVYQTIPAQ